MTPRLSRERLPALHGQTPRFFGNWLRNGVSRFVAGGGRDSFPGAANYVGWAGAIEEDLAAIFGVLAPAEQSAFREGVGTALAEMSMFEPQSGDTLNSLIRLAGLVQAREAVDVIVPVLLAAAIAGVEDVEEAYRRAFDLVVELASPAPQAVHALRTMLTSDGFRDELAAPALVALSRVDPTGFAAHLDALARPLNAQYHPDRLDAPGGRTTADRDRLLEAIAGFVPLAAITPALGASRGSAHGSDWIVYDWFMRGLSTSETSRVVTLWRGVQDWVSVSISKTERSETIWDQEDDGIDVLDAALGRLPAMAGDDDW